MDKPSRRLALYILAALVFAAVGGHFFGVLLPRDIFSFFGGAVLCYILAGER